ncbi:TetR/AcrR family transcriptional regulator [Streptacidiphilus albus]|uniref:TetR/AcrR family transcriptional regulator n=1 Tax=Streptacidiphilus albus TaxID=105425 RepID=UPI0005A6ECCC|nr:TetR/AcrR family transcriptional regulator [Streptacidiphilus albus]
MEQGAGTGAATGRAQRGRPRAYDLDQVLRASVQVFCERGLHGTSIMDLAGATGLTTGSLYKAFADKDAMYRASLEWQSSQREAELRERMDTGTTGLDKLRAVLEFIADLSSGLAGHEGCLVVETTVGIGAREAGIGEVATRVLERRRAMLVELIELGRADGSVRTDVDSGAVAATLLCLTQGMRVVGKTGPAPEAMASVVSVALTLLT